MGSAHEVDFFDDPREFLAAAGDHLAAEPGITSVVSMVAARWARRFDAGHVELPDHPVWWAVVRDDEVIVGAAMGTAPFPPYPIYVLPMPDPAATALADALLARGQAPGGVNGAQPAGSIVAERIAAASGGQVEVHERLRFFELDELEMPPSPPGRLRLARAEEGELALAWFRDFHVEADRQAGREPDPSQGEHFGLDDMAERISEARLWFWVDEYDRPVHMTAANLPQFGANRIGPVFTPPAQRGHGHASRAVAEVSRLCARDGVRVTLFTDRANPVSNGIYTAIGYRPVMDTASLRITRPGQA